VPIEVRVGIGASVQFDHADAGLLCGIELPSFRVDKDGHADSALTELAACCLHPVELGYHIQATFRRDFLASLWHETTIRWPNLSGNTHHFVRDGHFEVHAGLQGRFELTNIGILNMPSVFSKVDSNTISTVLLG
jgi:hypothetical protein